MPACAASGTHPAAAAAWRTPKHTRIGTATCSAHTRAPPSGQARPCAGSERRSLSTASARPLTKGPRILSVTVLPRKEKSIVPWTRRSAVGMLAQAGDWVAHTTGACCARPGTWSSTAQLAPIEWRLGHCAAVGPGCVRRTGTLIQKHTASAATHQELHKERNSKLAGPAAKVELECWHRWRCRRRQPGSLQARAAAGAWPRTGLCRACERGTSVKCDYLILLYVVKTVAIAGFLSAIVVFCAPTQCGWTVPE